ncbi:ORF8 [Halogeometricum pleomorphic virus 1]|uniref:ORF8 n=1 Tax=Halogeometricum pleomorphic virus 1 TaxID=1156722 RepID=H9ABQ9_9VIRU|nr:ORF8 [Halogeometricum pleomorphic virus 1]AFD04029.1 ORF8 [Halogeometricum pleomorphic virus 1]
MTASSSLHRHHYPTPGGAYLSIVEGVQAGGCGGPVPSDREISKKTTMREKIRSVGQYG